MQYEVDVTDSALDDLGYLKKAEQNVVLGAIDKQLTATPDPDSKPQTAPAQRSVRMGNARRFLSGYDVEEEASKVLVKAVGWKEHNTLFIRGKEYPL